MLKIYFLVAFRKLVKEKIYVAINIFSLGFGIGSFLILALYLRSELTFDQHFANHESIYRISTHFTTDDGVVLDFAITQEGFGPLLVQDYPQLGTYVRFRDTTQNVLSYQDIHFSWDDIYLADENVFGIFNHEILAGDMETAFSDMNSIAVSESFARSYFGEEDPIGKILESGVFSYRVTLVFADLPENSHFKYSALYPYKALSQFIPNYEDNYIRGLNSVNVFTYLMVNPSFDPASFDGIVEEFVDKYMIEPLAQLDSSFRAELTALDEVHFADPIPRDRPNGNIFYVYGLAAVALFILLIACINYVNLATARATTRSKEVGMRKVVGATRSQLIGQLLGESLIFTLVALLFGVVVAVLALVFTPISALMGKEALLAGLQDPTAILAIIGLATAVTLLSGLYPAFYLSSISPEAALSGARNSWRRGLSVRQTLVLAQMAISIGVIACTLLMSQQMRYVATKPLGFNKENQVWVDLRGADVIEDIPTLRNELISESNIIDVVDLVQIPGFVNGRGIFQVKSNEGIIAPEQMDLFIVGLNFADGLDIEVVEGRTFSLDRSIDDTSSIMVNETTVRKMGWDEPIGKQISNGVNINGTVIGVTGDFHYTSLNNEIGPLLIIPLSYDFSNFSEQIRSLLQRSIVINITGDSVEETLGIIEEKVRQFDPAHVFDPSFIDTRLDELYESETNLIGLTEIFAAICILISAMGLFGMASFNTEQRSKEIGIRKVLGASAHQITILLCRNLVMLLIAAAIPATIVSYMAINNWVERFAYRAEPDLFGTALPFLTAIISVSFIALATVAVQSLKTAQSNPIEVLRYE